VKPGLGQRRHDLAPGIGDLGKAVQQQHQWPARRGIARLENMDVEAIYAADKTGADAGRQRCGFERRREHGSSRYYLRTLNLWRNLSFFAFHLSREIVL
jgi:hypothetical protein